MVYPRYRAGQGPLPGVSTGVEAPRYLGWLQRVPLTGVRSLPPLNTYHATHITQPGSGVPRRRLLELARAGLGIPYGRRTVCRPQ